MRITKRITALAAVPALALGLGLAACSSGGGGPGGAKNGAPAPSSQGVGGNAGGAGGGTSQGALLTWSCSIVTQSTGLIDAQLTVSNAGSAPVTYGSVTYRVYASQTYQGNRLGGGTVPAGGTRTMDQQVATSLTPADLAPQSCSDVSWTPGTAAPATTAPATPAPTTPAPTSAAYASGYAFGQDAKNPSSVEASAVTANYSPGESACAQLASVPPPLQALDGQNVPADLAPPTIGNSQWISGCLASLGNVPSGG